jgi:hypothetical protein
VYHDNVVASHADELATTATPPIAWMPMQRPPLQRARLPLHITTKPRLTTAATTNKTAVIVRAR